MKKKEEVTITFYAAECGEFHDLGEYTKCRTLEEAYKKYQKYCRTSANMCPAIEFSIHDPESIYSDMEYPLPLSSKDRGDLELVPYYNEHPLVNEAIRQEEQLQKQQEKKKICDWDLMDRVVPGNFTSHRLRYFRKNRNRSEESRFRRGSAD